MGNRKSIFGAFLLNVVFAIRTLLFAIALGGSTLALPEKPNLTRTVESVAGVVSGEYDLSAIVEQAELLGPLGGADVGGQL